METSGHGFARVIVLIATAIGCGLAQEAAPEKHVKDIRAEQTQEMISASPLCQRVRTDGHGYMHKREVDPATLEKDLTALMQKSDEVVLASIFRTQTRALSPSGEEVIEYFDVKVLRTWKGSHKVGDLLTFAMPWGAVYCGIGPVPIRGAGNASAFTMTGGFDWETIRYAGPYVLFLRHSRGDETQLLPGLRLTGGDGMQGLFVVKYGYSRECTGVWPDSVAKCSSILEASPETVAVRYRRDPLKKMYEGMPVPSFLNEVQALADSLGYPSQTGTTK